MENYTNLKLYKYLIMTEGNENCTLYTTLPSEDLEVFLQAYLIECRYMSGIKGNGKMVDEVEYLKRRLQQDGVSTFWESCNEPKRPVMIKDNISVVQLHLNNKEG